MAETPVTRYYDKLAMARIARARRYEERADKARTEASRKKWRKAANEDRKKAIEHLQSAKNHSTLSSKNRA
jgi:hypothetical protein